jgi:hypothetical protein
MMVAVRSSETPVLIRVTRRNIPVDDILTFSLVYYLEFLATDPEVPGSILGAATFCEK